MVGRLALAFQWFRVLSIITFTRAFGLVCVMRVTGGLEKLFQRVHKFIGFFFWLFSVPQQKNFSTEQNIYIDKIGVSSGRRRFERGGGCF